MQRGFHGDSWIILLFQKLESSGSSRRIFLSGLYALRPSLTVEVTRIPKVLGLFRYFFFAGISGIFPQNPAPKSLYRSLKSCREVVVIALLRLITSSVKREMIDDHLCRLAVS